jgi:uncharacterized protein involved in oxidation of intracellular sulfur
MTKVLITINDPPYGTERAYNALRLAANLLKKEPATELRIFLVGDAAACAKAGQSVPAGYYHIENMVKAVVRRNGVVGVCGTCMDARGIKDVELIAGTRRSSLDEWTEWLLWAEKSLVF